MITENFIIYAILTSCAFMILLTFRYVCYLLRDNGFYKYVNKNNELVTKKAKNLEKEVKNGN